MKPEGTNTRTHRIVQVSFPIVYVNSQYNFLIKLDNKKSCAPFLKKHTNKSMLEKKWNVMECYTIRYLKKMRNHQIIGQKKY